MPRKLDSEIMTTWFALALANGHRWAFGADERCASWLARFARAAGLAPGFAEGTRKIRFLSTPGNLSDERISTALDFWLDTKTPVVHHATQIHEAQVASIMSKRPGENAPINFQGDQEEFGDIICLISGLEDNAMEVMLMWQALAPIYDHAEDAGGLLVHGSLIVRGDEGALLLGSSGSGKTTCSRRIPSEWRSLCDDEVLLVVDEKGGLRAHPFPTWSNLISGSSEQAWKVQDHAAVRAVFFLQSGDKDRVEVAGEALAAVLISRSSQEAWLRYERGMATASRRTRIQRRFLNASRVAKAVSSFHLTVSREGRFWVEMSRVLGSEKCRKKEITLDNERLVRETNSDRRAAN